MAESNGEEAAGRQAGGWRFGIDRGGAVTDAVARGPERQRETLKRLSENPGRQFDAAIADIRAILSLGPDAAPPVDRIAFIQMGTRVATIALLGALGIVASAQASMNNLLFGDARRQYYKTICGGAGAGAGFDGASAVHTHMTNTRMTDPEVFELRYPVRVETFTLRAGLGGLGRRRSGAITPLAARERAEVAAGGILGIGAPGGGGYGAA